MLRSPLVCAGLSFAAFVGVVYAAGCSSTEVEPAPVDQVGAVPPPPPESGGTLSGDGYVFAVSKLFLGDTTRAGAPDPNAWKVFGYNLDARVSTKASVDLCQPSKGAAPNSVYPDGTNGIDNSFGKNLLPIITGLAPDASSQVNEELAAGSFTIMVSMEGLGSEPDYLDVLSKLYAGSTLPTVPRFDGTDEWPVVPELLEDPTDISTAKVQFPTAYVNGHTWVSGTSGDLTLSLSVQGFTLALKISKAVLTMDLDPDRSGATNGTIAGVLPTEELINELKKVAGSFDEGLCEGTTFDSLADQLRQASDIMQDGTQNPGETCDGISIGLGFEAQPVKLGEIGPETPPEPDPCDPSSAGGGGAGGGGEGGSAEGGSAEGGSAEGGSAEGGSAEGGAGGSR